MCNFNVEPPIYLTFENFFYIATSLFTYEEIPYCYKCDLNDVSLVIYSSVVRGAL